MTQARSGIVLMVAACTIWGLSPLFYKLISHIPAIEILAHRTLWSTLFFVGVLMVQGRLGLLGHLLLRPGNALSVLVAALLIGTNWYIFIWAVGVERTTEASLGYFIFPLVAVLLGRVLFAERLSVSQWMAVALAGIAVALLTWGLGVLPWISLLIAFSFGLYGVAKKRLSAGPVVSVTAEVAMLSPIAVLVIMAFGTTGGAGIDRIMQLGQPGGLSLADMGLLLLSGPLTALPLILFSAAARKVPLATVGLVQYINPTLQFLCATLVFAEPVSRWHAIAFPVIWGALVIYTMSVFRQDRAARRARRQASTDLAVSQIPLSEGSAKP